MNKNEIFILCLGIGILIIFVAILSFAKGDTVFILSVFAVAVALILIGICLYLMNNMLNKLDDNTKIAGFDLGLLKDAVTYIAQDNNNASDYISQFLEAYVTPNKDIDTENVKIYVPDELSKTEASEAKTEGFKDTLIEVEPVQNLRPKDTINLRTTMVSNRVLTDALKKLVENMNTQNVNINQTVQQVQQVQETAIQTVVTAIQSDPVVQQAIAESQPLISAITQTEPIQQIIVNGGNIDLTEIRESINTLNTVTSIQSAGITTMDTFLKFVDQTSEYVDQDGNPTTLYNGVDISTLQAIIPRGTDVNLASIQESINNLNNIVTSQGTDLVTIDNYLKFVDQSLLFAARQAGNVEPVYPGINN